MSPSDRCGSSVMRVEILPYHSSGFIFMWRLSDTFTAPAPYRFTVQVAPTDEGPWQPVSPELEDTYVYAADRVKVNKAATRNYRVVLTDADGRRHCSEPVMAYGDLGLRDFLLAREIIRKETLLSRKYAGTVGQAWISASWGGRCPHCLDPITGQVRNSHCRKCHGTGFYPSHYGPFGMWMQFSQEQHGAAHDEVGGTKDDKQFTVRVVGTPRLKKNDIIMDSGSGLMYYVQSVVNAAEVRRIPVVQQLTVSEAAVTDQCYDLKRHA